MLWLKEPRRIGQSIFLLSNDLTIQRNGRIDTTISHKSQSDFQIMEASVERKPRLTICVAVSIGTFPGLS